MTRALHQLILLLMVSLLNLASLSMPALACPQGMSWGMDRATVEKELGVELIDIGQSVGENLFEVENFLIGNLQVEKLRFKLAEKQGLQRLAIDIEPSDMTEVLASLRHQFGPPVTTMLEEEGKNLQQEWVWNTGEDLITAIRKSNDVFLLDYKPTRLAPDSL